MGQPSPFATSAPALHSGSALNKALAAGAASFTDTITALAGGGATGAPVLSTRRNRAVALA